MAYGVSRASGVRRRASPGFPRLRYRAEGTLQGLKRPDGRAFPVVEAAEVLLNMLGRMPFSAVLRDGLVGLKERGILHGDLAAMMDVDGGTMAIEEKTVRRFLEGR